MRISTFPFVSLIEFSLCQTNWVRWDENLKIFDFIFTFDVNTKHLIFFKRFYLFSCDFQLILQPSIIYCQIVLIGKVITSILLFLLNLDLFICKHGTTATRLCPKKNIAQSMIVDVLIYLFLWSILCVFSITFRFTITASSYRIFILHSLHYFFSYNTVCFVVVIVFFFFLFLSFIYYCYYYHLVDSVVLS